MEKPRYKYSTFNAMNKKLYVKGMDSIQFMILLGAMAIGFVVGTISFNLIIGTIISSIVALIFIQYFKDASIKNREGDPDYFTGKQSFKKSFFVDRCNIIKLLEENNESNRN